METICAVVGMKRAHECMEKADRKLLKAGAKENTDSESLISVQDKSADGSDQCNNERVLPHKALLKMAGNTECTVETENTAVDPNSPEGWEMPTEFRCLEEDHISGAVECDCINPPLTGPVFAGHNTQVTGGGIVVGGEFFFFPLVLAFVYIHGYFASPGLLSQNSRTKSLESWCLRKRNGSPWRSGKCSGRLAKRRPRFSEPTT